MKHIVRAAHIAALYFALTVLLAPISYGVVQFRISEALCILPLLMPEAAIGVAIGCLCANVYGGNPLDIIVGTACTAVSCLIQLVIRKYVKKDVAKCYGPQKLDKLMGCISKIILGVLPHIIINSVFVPMVILGAEELKTAYIAAMLSVALGEAVVLCVLGVPLYFAVKKLSLGIVHTNSDDDYDKK